MIEPVVLYGKGSRVDMQVDGQSARSGKPLTFEILKHHLADCHNPKRKFIFCWFCVEQIFCKK